jgi:cytochrome c-type biogenesis protein CcmH/NrfF
VIRFVAVVVAALALAPSALACTAHPSQAQLEGQVMCPVCGTTLDQSDSPAAQQIKDVIRRRIAAGDSDCRIKDRLVQSYGESILAAWRWSRARETEPPVDASLNGHGVIDPNLDRRVDEELARYDG